MTRKEAEKWICDNTNAAFWCDVEKKAHPLSNGYYNKLNSLINESKNDNNPLPVMGANDGAK